MNLDNRLLTIMWTHIANTNLKMWTPNHFVPCIVKRHLQRKLSLFGLGQKGVHRTSFRTVRRKKTVAESPAIKRKENLIGKKKRQKGQICKIEEYGVTACIILP